jgi:hypothetical protein
MPPHWLRNLVAQLRRDLAEEDRRESLIEENKAKEARAGAGAPIDKSHRRALAKLAKAKAEKLEKQQEIVVRAIDKKRDKIITERKGKMNPKQLLEYAIKETKKLGERMMADFRKTGELSKEE